MNIRKITLLFLFLSAFIVSVFPQEISSGSKSLTSPAIDGKISESEWADSEIFTNFYLTMPRSDEKYYDSTIVMVRQTDDAINFAFKFWPKGKIISKSFTRDRTTDEESEFFILLDLENKNQNGYFFAFSFLNNQRDAVIFDQRNSSFEWDWVWECKSTIYKEATDSEPGYIESEVKIPVDKLQNKNTKSIGFDLQMFAYKPDGTLYAYSVIPSSEIMSLKNTHKMDLKKPFSEKLNLNFNIAPYAVANQINGKKLSLSLGGDVNISFENHKLKSTVNTDQSTLEADPFRFTFYNRPVFLQEKRPFFSKDLDIYQTPINLFYTRSIDSINYGVNYTYRSDKLKAGFVYVNEPKDTTSKTFIAARPNFNFPDFNIGGLFIYTNDKRTGSIERIFSLDGTYRVPGTRLRLSSQTAGSFAEKKGLAYVVKGNYEADYSGGPSLQVSYGRIDEEFNSSTSFNSQIGAPNDFDELFIMPGYTLRYNRKYFTDITANLIYYRGRQLSSGFIYQERIGSEIYYRVNDWISMYHYIEYNRPNDIDESGNIIRRNNYDINNNIKFLFGSTALNIGYEFGDYYMSFIKHPYINLDMVLFERISLRAAYDYRTVFDIKQSIFSVRLDWRIIPKLYLRSYYQQDTYNRLAIFNTMMQYEFFAGSSIYLALNLQGEKLKNTGRYSKIGYEFNF